LTDEKFVDVVSEQRLDIGYSGGWNRIRF